MLFVFIVHVSARHVVVVSFFFGFSARDLGVCRVLCVGGGNILPGVLSRGLLRFFRGVAKSGVAMYWL